VEESRAAKKSLIWREPRGAFRAGSKEGIEMKKLLSTLLLVMVLSSAASAGGNQYALAIDGLACPFCAYGIEKNLSAIEGVESVETDIKSGQVVVTLAEGKTLSEEVARQAIKDAGFTLRSLKQTRDSE
jgi:mercuric ion binding protein